MIHISTVLSGITLEYDNVVSMIMTIRHLDDLQSFSVMLLDVESRLSSTIFEDPISINVVDSVRTTLMHTSSSIVSLHSAQPVGSPQVFQKTLFIEYGRYSVLQSSRLWEKRLGTRFWCRITS